VILIGFPSLLHPRIGEDPGIKLGSIF
jgi:hypothetical protein